MRSVRGPFRVTQGRHDSLWEFASLPYFYR